MGFYVLPPAIKISTPAQAVALVEHLRTAQLLAFDTETSGLTRHKERAVILSLSDGKSRWAIWPEAIPYFQELLENPALRLVGHNANFDQWMLLNVGIDLDRRCARNHARVYDTMVMHALLDDAAPHDLKYLSRAYLDIDMVPFKQVYGKQLKTRSLVEVLLDPANEAVTVNYSALDAFATYKLFLVLQRALQKTLLRPEKRGDYEPGRKYPPFANMWQYYTETEVLYTKVLWHMERRGILLDVEALLRRAPILEREILDIEKWFCHKLRSFAVNLKSNPQMSDLFFKKLGYKPMSYTDGGLPQLNKAALKQWAKDGCEYAAALLRYRDLSKQLDTYVIGLLDHLAADGRIHTRFNQTGARTGRLSSAEPNLQNQPGYIRDAYIAKRGFKLMARDQQQLEMRILAHVSGDHNLCEAIRTGKDVHSATGANMYNASYEAIMAAKHKDDIGEKLDADEKRLLGFRKNAKCFHLDTEVLTRTGWKRISALVEGEEIIQAEPQPGGTVALSWVVPTEVFTTRHPSGQLVHLLNEGMDLRVTPDHRMLAFRKDGSHKVVMPADMAKARYWANAGTLHGCTWEPDEHLLRLAVATQADGSLVNGAIRFGFTRERKIRRMEQLLLNTPHTRGVSKNGKNPDVTWFRVARAHAAPILALLDGKSFAWSWLALSEKSRGVVLAEAALWDGHTQEGWRAYSFATSDQQSAEILQALAAITGRKTRLSRRCSDGSHAEMLALTVRDRHSTRGGNLSITTQAHDEEVACLSVPSTFVLVRDGTAKIPVVTGQTLNFGIMYGMGPSKLARSLGVPLDEAKSIIEKYFAAVPGVKDYFSRIIAEARHTGYSSTIMGRRRQLPGIWSLFSGDVARAERQVKNAPIQGFASEILKVAMNRIFVDPVLVSMGVEMLIQVHDELVFELPAQYEKDPVVVERIQMHMVTAITDTLGYDLLVPLDTSGKSGNNWNDCK